MAEDAEYLCSKCDQPITARALIVGDKYFHPECFACAHCLTPLSTSFCEKDGQNYCGDCHNELFSPKCDVCKKAITGSVLSLQNKSFHPECFGCEFCGVQISPGGGIAIKNDKRCCKDCKPHFCQACNTFCAADDRNNLGSIKRPFCKKCIKCSKCSMALTMADAFVFNNKIFCSKHLDGVKSTSVDTSAGCAMCGEKITGKAMLALDKQWHVDCFKCASEKCDVKLGKKFYEIDGMPYCAKHRHTKPKPKRVATQALPAVPPPAAGADAGRVNDEPLYDSMQAEYAMVQGGPAPAPTAAPGATPEYAEPADAIPRATPEYAAPDYAAPDNYAALDDYDNAEFRNFNAAAGNAPAPEPAPTAELVVDADYDNAEFAALSSSAAGGGGGGGDEQYDNADFAAAAVPASLTAADTYDNTDFAAAAAVSAPVPAALAAEDVYDNADFAAPAAPAGAGARSQSKFVHNSLNDAPAEPDYDNNDYPGTGNDAPDTLPASYSTIELEGHGGRHGGEHGGSYNALNTATRQPAMSQDELIEKKVQEKLAAEKVSMELRIRAEIAAETKASMAAAAAAAAKPPPAAAPPPPHSTEATLLAEWKSPQAPKQAEARPPGRSAGETLSAFKGRRALPKPRSSSTRN